VRRSHAQANNSGAGARPKRVRNGETIVVPDDENDEDDVEDLFRDGDEGEDQDFEVLGNSSRVNVTAGNTGGKGGRRVSVRGGVWGGRGGGRSGLE
jgi:hypothetical protein